MPIPRYARMLTLVCILLIPFVFSSPPAQGQDPYTLEWELAAHANGSLVAVMWITPPEGQYIYSHSPGPMGQPTAFLPEGDAVLAVRYPIGKEKQDSFDPTVTIRAYEGRSPLFLELGEAQAPFTVTGTLRMLLCSDTSCWPINDALSQQWETVPVPLPEAASHPWWEEYEAAQVVAADAPPAQPMLPSTQDAPPSAASPEGATQPEAAGTELEYAFMPQYFQPGLEVSSLGKALLFAFLAGIILNAMPCVLPVVSLKLSALMAVSGEEDRQQQTAHLREHAIWFALGIFTFFLLLGGVLGAAGLAWGQLFQQAELILGLAVLLFTLGLSLFGVFDLPMIDLKGAAAAGATGSPKLQAFSTGMLATLLATPCSGPLLGGVLGWTLSRSPAIILPVFLTIGLGMALPYLLLAIRPGLVRKLPKAGAWCLHMERGMGFLLMGTTIYLVHILPEFMLLPALICLWVAAVAAWMWGQWTTLSQPAGLRWGIRGVAVAILGVSIAWALTPPSPSLEWGEFTPASFQETLGKEPLLLDFTADWCPNCKVLESTTLSDDNMRGWQEQYGLTIIKVDLTQEDPQRMALLQALGSQSIPIVALFPVGAKSTQPLVLRDLFTAGQLEEALATTFSSAP